MDRHYLQILLFSFLAFSVLNKIQENFEAVKS